MKEQTEEVSIKCPDCGTPLRDRNSQDVGVCLPCFAIRMSDFDEVE